MSGWYLSHRIPEQEALKLLAQGLKLPAGIVVIGGDDPSKQIAIDALIEYLGASQCQQLTVTTVSDLEQIPEAHVFDSAKYAIVNIVGSMGASCDFRFTLTNRLHDVGAQTTVLIWVGCDPSQDPYGVERYLRERPPAMDDLDYSIAIKV